MIKNHNVKPKTQDTKLITVRIFTTGAQLTIRTGTNELAILLVIGIKTTVSAITVVEKETVVQTGTLGRTVRITVAHVSHKQELYTMQAQNP